MTSRLARLFKAVGIAIGVLLLQAAIVLLIAPFFGDTVVATVMANVAISLFVLWMRWSSPQRFTYGDAPGRLTRRALGWMAAGLPPTVFAAQGASRWAAENLDTSQIDEIQRALESSNETLLLITIIVAAPVGEELLMRGFLYPILRRRVSMWPAVAISALAFAVMHGNYQQGLLAIVLGVFLAVVVERTRRVWPTIIVHMAANASAVVLPTEWQEVLTSAPAMALFGVATVVAVIRIAKDRGPAVPADVGDDAVHAGGAMSAAPGGALVAPEGDWGPAAREGDWDPAAQGGDRALAARGEDRTLVASDDGALATHGGDPALVAQGGGGALTTRSRDDHAAQDAGDSGAAAVAGPSAVAVAGPSAAGTGAVGPGAAGTGAVAGPVDAAEPGPGEDRPTVAGRELANPSDADEPGATPATTDRSEGNPG